MRCCSVQDIYSYIEGELVDTERAAFKEHIRSCARCRQALELRTRLTEAACGLTPLELPVDFTQRVMSALPPVRKRTAWGWLAAAGFATLSLSVAFLGVVLLSGRGVSAFLKGFESFLFDSIKTGTVVFSKIYGFLVLSFNIIRHFLSAVGEALSKLMAAVPLPALVLTLAVLVFIVSLSCLIMRKVLLGERS